MVIGVAEPKRSSARLAPAERTFTACLRPLVRHFGCKLASIIASARTAGPVAGLEGVVHTADAEQPTDWRPTSLRPLERITVAVQFIEYRVS